VRWKLRRSLVLPNSAHVTDMALQPGYIGRPALLSSRSQNVLFADLKRT
jgi:glutaredoxin-related protein